MSDNKTSLVDNGFYLYNIEKFSDIPELKDATRQLYKITHERPKSIIVELNMFRKYVPVLIKYVLTLSSLNNDITNAQQRIMDSSCDNNNKRWSKEEDGQLIEQACDPNNSLTHLSVIFGRSPQAISSRLTTLVGRKRLSQDIAGRFVGYIDGVKSESDIVGTIYKGGQS